MYLSYIFYVFIVLGPFGHQRVMSHSDNGILDVMGNLKGIMSLNSFFIIQKRVEDDIFLVVSNKVTWTYNNTLGLPAQ